jgi:heterodisulfide reductase subunit A
MAAVPGAEAVILHRDIMTQGVNLEDYYRRAMSLGVRFIRFDPENPPRVEGEHQVEAVNVYDVLSGKDLRLDADMVVLSTPLAPHDENGELARILGLRLDRHGFFSGSEPMHPLTTFVDGVFLCGSARWPVSVDQAVLQGRAAAIKAFGFLTDSSTTAKSLQGCIPGPPAGLASVDTEICSGCGNCVAACPFQACSLLKTDQSTRSFVDKIRCKGCGTCMSVCLNGAIQIPENNTRRTREILKSAFSRSGIH